MKRLLTAIATAMFATGASAAGVYQGLAQGNPDLRSVSFYSEQITAVQPRVGDSVERYQGLGRRQP